MFFIQIQCFAADKVIVLDPGHGGADTGAVYAPKGIVERDANLKIAQYLKEYLEEYAGVTVILTHNGLAAGTSMKLEDRVLVARKNNADLLLCLHCNSSPSGNLHGAEAFVTVNNSLPKYNEECTKIGNLILNNLNKLGITNRGVKTRLSGDSSDRYSDGTLGDYYGIIRFSMMNGLNPGSKINIQKGEGISTVLVEHCFVNGSDNTFLTSEKGLRKLAKADCDAVVEHYGLKLKKEVVGSVSLDKSEVKIVKNTKEKLTATVLPETAINKKVKWTSSDEKIAKVDENGEIAGVGVGTATITATTEDGGFTATSNVTVSGIEIEDKEVYLLTGEKYLIEYSPIEMPIDFKIDNNEIISIDENRNIVALKEGTATITITSKLDKALKETVIVNVTRLNEEQKLVINNIKEEKFKLTRINEKTTINKFKKYIEVSKDFDIQIENNEEEFITTGTVINIVNKASNKIIKKYKCCVFGDINQDGKISAADYVLIKNHIMETSRIDSKLLEAADVSRDNNVSAKDYILIKNHIMNGTDISIE
jgi:N-acetylmuramoyl-L-alanine amidase